MPAILKIILDLVRTHGSLSMFLGGIVEQIIVPIPSPIITMSGGAFLISHKISLFQVFCQIIYQISLPYSIGATIGTSLIFLITFFGGKPLINKFGKYIGISWNLIEKIRLNFQKTIRDELFIFIAVIIPIVPVSLMSGFCGAFRFKPSKFYPIIFLSLIIRSAILSFIGFQMGEAFISLANGLDKIESILTVIGIFLILGFLFIKREKWIKKNN